MNENSMWTLCTLLVVSMFVELAVVGKGCCEASEKTMQTCLTSGRPIAECALIGRGRQ